MTAPDKNPTAHSSNMSSRQLTAKNRSMYRCFLPLCMTLHPVYSCNTMKSVKKQGTGKKNFAQKFKKKLLFTLAKTVGLCYNIKKEYEGN